MHFINNNNSVYCFVGCSRSAMATQKRCRPGQLAKVLKKIYFDIKSPGGFGGVQPLYREAKKSLTCYFTPAMVAKWLKVSQVYTLHKPAVKKFPRLPVVVDGPELQLQADLIDYLPLKAENDGYRYLLVVVDCFSRKAWVEPLKTKSASDVMVGLKLIMDRCGFVPEKFQTDLGKEFYNAPIEQYLTSLGVKHFSTNNAEIKAGLVERLNRTISTKLFRYLYHKGNRRWIDVIQDLITTYNNSPHRTLGFRPPDTVTKENADEFADVIYAKNKMRYLHKRIGTHTFKLGDYVRP